MTNREQILYAMKCVEEMTNREQILYAMKCVEHDRGNASDNLYRAQAVAKRCDPTQQYRHSGQTLNEIIAGYQSWYDKAQATLVWLRQHLESC